MADGERWANWKENYNARILMPRGDAHRAEYNRVRMLARDFCQFSRHRNNNQRLAVLE